MAENNEKMSDRIDSDRANEFLESQHLLDIKTDFMGRLVTIIIAALGLITALAWDRTLEDIFTTFFGPLSSLAQKILYASVITIMTVVLTILLRRMFITKETFRIQLRNLHGKHHQKKS